MITNASNIAVRIWENHIIGGYTAIWCYYNFEKCLTMTIISSVGGKIHVD